MYIRGLGRKSGTDRDNGRGGRFSPGRLGFSPVWREGIGGNWMGTLGLLLVASGLCLEIFDP